MASSRIDVIPESHRALLDGPIVVSLATQMKSGQIQVQPVWCSYDGRHILVNTEKQLPTSTSWRSCTWARTSTRLASRGMSGSCSGSSPGGS